MTKSIPGEICPNCGKENSIELIDSRGIHDLDEAISVDRICVTIGTSVHIHPVNGDVEDDG